MLFAVGENHPTVLFLCPNYEDRSVAFPNKIRDEVLNVKGTRIYPEIFYLQNETENSAILDALKYQQFDELEKSFLLAENRYHRINFPDNFSSAELHKKSEDRVNRCGAMVTGCIFFVIFLEK